MQETVFVGTVKGMFQDPTGIMIGAGCKAVYRTVPVEHLPREDGELSF